MPVAAPGIGTRYARPACEYNLRDFSLNPRTDLVLVGVGMRKVPSELG